MDQPILMIVVPCYNEEEVLPETAKRLSQKLSALENQGAISSQSRILFVDDGSRDKTWEIICSLHRQDPVFSGAKLSRNRGHQNALLCGLMAAKELCDVAVSMDADLQDDIDAVDEMLQKYKDGAEIVYGVRSSRQTDTAFKRATAQGFYRFMAWMGVDIVYNHADYRLMSKRALNALSEYREVNLFLRGIVPLIGFQTATVEYERGERFAGESKYPLKKMLAFAFDGITSFSVRPIRLITVLGILILCLSVLCGVYDLIALLFSIPFSFGLLGLSVWFCCGLQLTALGLVGEYVGKVYSEVKARPRYHLETLLDTSNEGKNE